MGKRDRETVVTVIKAAITFRELLSDFERDFTSGFANRYARFGLNTNVEGEQITVFKDIHNKLCL